MRSHVTRPAGDSEYQVPCTVRDIPRGGRITGMGAKRAARLDGGAGARFKVKEIRYVNPSLALAVARPADE